MSRVDAKVVLLGKSYVGKTCLVNKYVHHRFDANLPYQNTIGAAFGSKKETVDGKPIVLGIWDTAGHERYESMTRMYYRGAVACILCYDITDKGSFDKARFWAGELKSTQEDCRIYLCGTKKDIADDNPNKREVDKKVAEPLATDFQCQLYETSSLTGENVDELFKQIARDIIEKRESAAREIREQEETINLYTGRDSDRQGCALFKCWS
ncbi:ras-related protein Rab-24-like isoform X1 [Ruditapes philippinarum]|uniref:ras-related protein Rab-24-like isoform X1 n=1 Tax=Ruditapes philippinarum TaxID=129788 RepID=UPI00295AD90B|nr:ras-related protein Rab-24-like isoform X1 [Ruditapes philippinarum]